MKKNRELGVKIFYYVFGVVLGVLALEIGTEGKFSEVCRRIFGL